MRVFILYNGEDKIKNFIEVRNEIIPTPEQNSSDPLKKKRELFHALTFLSIEKYGYTNTGIPCIQIGADALRMPKDGEGADIELFDNSRKRAIEITECFDMRESYIKFKNEVNGLLSGENEDDLTMVNETAGLKDSFFGRINDKNSKIGEYKKGGYNTELLIVTHEAYDNCSVTGTWVEKCLDKSEIEHNMPVFDEVHVLIYRASPKNGGPIIRKYPEDFLSISSINF